MWTKSNCTVKKPTKIYAQIQTRKKVNSYCFTMKHFGFVLSIFSHNTFFLCNNDFRLFYILAALLARSLTHLPIWMRKSTKKNALKELRETNTLSGCQMVIQASTRIKKMRCKYSCCTIYEYINACETVKTAVRCDTRWL